MPEFTFCLVVEGLDVDADDDVSAFFDAGCHDATLEARGDQSVATFFRETASPEDALWTAVRDVSAIADHVRVVAVDLDLVSTADIAERVDVNPETVRTWSGARPLQAAEPFPPPAGVIGRGVAVWRWGDVAEWLHDHKPDVVDEITLSHGLTTAANALLATGTDGMISSAIRGSYHVSAMYASQAGQPMSSPTSATQRDLCP